ncbi:MAG: HAMP domain-containing histidine kinase [Clostridia bacterium]|nr:HAMP domain-containing histidine kinase [Clostridia bacterium]
MKKQKRTEKGNAGEDREIEIFKGITGLFRHLRFGTARNLRMSLTIRIAWHYCVQIIRSFGLMFLPILVICSLLLAPDAMSSRRRIEAEALDIGAHYTQTVIQNVHVEAVVSEEILPEKRMDRVGFYLSHLFQSGHRLKVCVPGMQRAKGGHLVMIYHDLRPALYAGVVLLTFLIVADCLRMLYFLRHHHRLDRTVLKPIRDMTDMAATVSANNLSNRINVSGLKYELQDLAMVINSMLDRLEVSYESQKQFVSDASHELRTPIAVIQGYADMLKRWGKDDPQILEEGIEAISQEAATMKDLVQDLLFLARHDKKTLMMEISTFDPVELLSEIKKEAEIVCPADTFALEPAEHMELTADRNMLKQAMRILLDNAIKYTEPGGRITMGVHKEHDCAIFRMEDTGSGISPEDLPHIFDRFYRADKARKAESGGHGLGLSIARIIVMAHGGKIRVRSKVDEGTIFFLEIPFTRRESGETEVPQQVETKRRRLRLKLKKHPTHEVTAV